MMTRLCLYPLIAFLILPAVCFADSIPNFASLNSHSSTIFECTFEFKSTRTQEQFAGRVKLTSVGELMLVVRRSDEPANECALGLTNFSLGRRSEIGDLLISGNRIDACTPALSEEMRGRLNGSLHLTLRPPELRKAPAQRSAFLSVIYLEGLRRCQVTQMDDKGINDLAQRYNLGMLKKKKRSIATERQDISKEQRRLNESHSK